MVNGAVNFGQMLVNIAKMVKQEGRIEIGQKLSC